MKFLSALFLIGLFSLNTFAGGFFDRDRDRGSDRGGWGRPNVTCTATDDGWEEHWGGHRDCGTCVAKHGDCTETCSASYYVCKASGVIGSTTYNVEARGETRYQTEDQAMRLCQSRYDNCTVVSCNQKSETVSRRACR